MRRAAADLEIPSVAPAQAADMWLELDRWPAFVDGLERVLEVTGDWPQAGSAVVWESHPDGRGVVRERVSAYEPGVRLTMAVEDERLRGRQTVAFERHEANTLVTLELEYELARSTFGGALVDALFIRPALGDSLARTLEGLAAELAGARHGAAG